MKRHSIPKDLLKNLYVRKRLTTYKIAERLGYCQGTVWNRLHEYGIKTRRPWNATGLTRQQLMRWYVEQELSTWEIEKRYGYRRGTVHRKLKEFRIPTRNLSQSHILYPRKDFRGTLSEKAYLVGFRIGDLRVRKLGDTIHVDCGSTKKAQINLIAKLFEKYGNIWISKPTRRGVIQIEAMLNISFGFLLFKNPPAWVFENKYFFPFLAGFTDAEGSIFIAKRGSQAVISWGNYNKVILQEIKRGLGRLDIKTGNIICDELKGYRGKDGYRRKENYCHLTCVRKASVKRLLTILKEYLRHHDKQRALRCALTSIAERK